MPLNKGHLSMVLANACIHFDNALYGYMVPLIAPLFFPKQDERVQLILGYSILIIACIAKPLSVILLYKLSAYLTRQRILRYILLGASLSQIAIGYLPTYSMLPLWGSLGLLACRFCMETFAAGAYQIARLSLIPQTDDRNQEKAFAACYEMSTMVGTILASAVATLLSSMKNPSPYWRLPFILAGLTTCLNLIFFRRSDDLTQMKDSLSAHPNYTFLNLLKVLWQERKSMMVIAIVTGFAYLTYSVPFLFMLKFIPMIASFSYVQMMAHTTPFMVIDLLLLGIMGKMSQKLNHRLLMLGASSIIAFTIIPIFAGLQGASRMYVLFARFWIMFWGVSFNCFLSVWFKEQLNKTPSYLILGCATLLGTALLGKPTTAICWMLYHTYNTPLAPACYLAVFASITTFLLMKTIKK